MGHVIQTSPSLGTASPTALVPADASSPGRDFWTGSKARSEVSAESPTDIDDDELEVTASNLPDKLGFSREFQAELEKVGGSSQLLAAKLLESHSTENLQFKAGQLCLTFESRPRNLWFFWHSHCKAAV